MADFTYKRGDTWPPLRLALREDVDGTESPVDLTNADSMRFLAESDDGLTTIDKTATVDGTATDGKVMVDWEVGDLDVVKEFNCEIEVTWNVGDIETFPNDSYFTLSVVQDLG